MKAVAERCRDRSGIARPVSHRPAGLANHRDLVMTCHLAVGHHRRSRQDA